MHTSRTRFGKDIVGEFLPPARPTKKQRVVIIASGAPYEPNKKSLMAFFSDKGYWTITFRYRGSWESKGKFLAQPHDQDIIEVINQLPKGLTDLWTRKKYQLKPDQIIVLSASFGGAAGILASRDKRIDKTIAISPVVDWRKPGPDEPYPKLIRYFEEAYGEAFRTTPNGWRKLQSGKFFNPVNHIKEIDGNNLLIIHDKDDRTCPYPATKKFALDTGTKLISLAKGDHMGSSTIMTPRFYKIFDKFVKAK